MAPAFGQRRHALINQVNWDAPALMVVSLDAFQGWIYA